MQRLDGAEEHLELADLLLAAQDCQTAYMEEVGFGEITPEEGVFFVDGQLAISPLKVRTRWPDVDSPSVCKGLVLQIDVYDDYYDRPVMQVDLIDIAQYRGPGDAKNAVGFNISCVVTDEIYRDVRHLYTTNKAHMDDDDNYLPDYPHVMARILDVLEAQADFLKKGLNKNPVRRIFNYIRMLVFAMS